MLKLSEVKKHPIIKDCISKSEEYLDSLGYTDHGERHLNLVADRAKKLAGDLKMNERDQELAAVAGYCHDMGNFLQRSNHCYTGAMLFSQLFLNESDDTEGVLEVMQAIANHDEQKKIDIINKIGAILVLADKTDVHRDRVREEDIQNIKKDIHDRVNYSVIESSFEFNKKSREITLKLKIDKEVTGVMEYFEIFTERMIFCRKAAEYLKCDFVLIINDFKLL
jgi:uncharacterized protein